MFTMQVYMVDGRVFEYQLESLSKIIEHAHAIVTKGYRHQGHGEEIEEWYPPHAILKLKYPANETNYTDTTRGT